MASKVVVNLDTSKENYLVAKCKQNDDLILEANIYEDGLALDLKNKAITIQALKADKTYIIQNTSITKENNKIIAELDKDFTRVPGKTLIEIVLVESGKQNTTFSFYLEVVNSVIKGAVESSNTVTILEALEKKIVEAGAVKEETEQLITSGGAATKGDIQAVNSQLEQKVNKNYVFGINTKDDTKGALDVANFSKQGQGSEPIGFVFHHYTDATMFQVDSVGENNEILVLKNAKNPTRRPDKASDFVGTGKFLVLKNHNNTLGNQISLFAIDKDCGFNWYEFTKTATLKHTKADDGTSAYDVICQNKHATMLRLLNGSSVVLDILNDGVDKTRMHIRSGTSQTGGIQLEARSGDLDLTATSGKIRINGHTRKIVQTTFYGSTAGERPTTTASIGEMFYDTTLKKPLWFDGTVWRDAMGTQV